MVEWRSKRAGEVSTTRRLQPTVKRKGLSLPDDMEHFTSDIKAIIRASLSLDIAQDLLQVCQVQRISLLLSGSSTSRRPNSKIPRRCGRSSTLERKSSSAISKHPYRKRLRLGIEPTAQEGRNSVHSRSIETACETTGAELKDRS